MTVLTVSSPRNDALEPLLASAIAAKLRTLQVAMRQTEARLTAFEQQYQRATADFIAAYARNEVDETLETIEWLGEYRMAQSLQDEMDALNAIQFGD